MVKFFSEKNRGGYKQRDEGPPDQIMEIGEAIHSSEENMLLCKATTSSVPWTNKSVFLENKAEIGKVDDVLGPITDFVFFT